MSDKPVEDWTPAALARWMAERDPLEIEYGPLPAVAILDDYTTSIDAAVGWLGRMGLEWERHLEYIFAWCPNGSNNVYAYSEETPEISTAHALCIAGVKAQMAKEATL